MSEWPLALYTLLVQSAAGLMLAAALQLRYGPFRPLMGILPPVLLLGGLMLSFFHLGRPARAAGALRNLGSSWMSREILLTLITLLSSCMSLVGGQSWAGVAALWGLFLVYATGRVYQLPGHPVWRHWSTVSQGFATALLLGPLAATALGGNPHVTPWLILAGVALLLISQAARWARRSPWFWSHIGLSAILPAMVAVTGAVPGGTLTWIALGAALLGEGIGRIDFYQIGLEQFPQF